MVKRTAPTVTSASDIAKYFLWRAAQDGKTLTNKKLQKLVYYAQAWHLAINNAPLFSDDIEAWIHGPVVFDVYSTYKKYGFGPIEEEVPTMPNVPSKDILDEVWQVYGGFDANYLERLTHGEEPWQLAREDMETHDRSSNTISHKSMRRFYRAMAENATDES